MGQVKTTTATDAERLEIAHDIYCALTIQGDAIHRDELAIATAVGEATQGYDPHPWYEVADMATRRAKALEDGDGMEGVHTDQDAIVHEVARAFTWMEIELDAAAARIRGIGAPGADAKKLEEGIANVAAGLRQCGDSLRSSLSVADLEDAVEIRGLLAKFLRFGM